MPVQMWTRFLQPPPECLRGYFYLKSRRSTPPSTIRTLTDDNFKLGSDVPIVIKRGVRIRGRTRPIGKYTFGPELQDIETYLRPVPCEKDRGPDDSRYDLRNVDFCVSDRRQHLPGLYNGKPLYQNR